jgi:hypothetical protein
LKGKKKVNWRLLKQVFEKMLKEVGSFELKKGHKTICLKCILNTTRMYGFGLSCIFTEIALGTGLKLSKKNLDYLF